MSLEIRVSQELLSLASTVSWINLHVESLSLSLAMPPHTIKNMMSFVMMIELSSVGLWSSFRESLASCHP